MNDPIKSFRLSNIVAMASNDSRSANGREVELLVRLVLLLLLLDFGPLCFSPDAQHILGKCSQ